MSVINGVVVQGVSVSANLVLCGPSSGSPAAPVFRALVAADLPITVNSGTAGQLAYYSASSATISGNADATISGGALTLGIAGTAAGSVILAQGASNSDKITISASQATANWTLNLPATAGTNLYVLQTDGSGNTSWVAQSGGGGTTVTAPFVDYSGYLVNGSLNNGRPGANAIQVYPFTLPYAQLVTNISVSIASGSSTIDWGIYSTAGTLLTHVGPQSSSTGIMTVGVSGGAVTIGPGTFLFAITQNSTSTFWYYSNQIISASGSMFIYGTSTTSSSGTLPGSITVGTTTPTLTTPTGQLNQYVFMLT